MLLGTFDRTVDRQWRIPLPSALLDDDAAGAGTFYIAPLNDCLVLFDAPSYRDFAARIQGRSKIADPAMRRWFFGNTYQKKRDRNGRVQIPEQLRPLSGLSAEEPVRIIGSGAYAEIRHPDRVPPSPAPEETSRFMETLLSLEGVE